MQCRLHADDARRACFVSDFPHADRMRLPGDLVDVHDNAGTTSLRSSRRPYFRERADGAHRGAGLRAGQGAAGSRREAVALVRDGG
jgi:hypothetical protein